MGLEPRILAYLKARIRRADTVLFTGAGFSRGAMNRLGKPMPLGDELRSVFWEVCYPGVPFDESSKLQDLFQVAQSRNPRGLLEALRQHLSVDPDSIPEYYAALLSLPWYSIYTLNVDDLAVAIGRKYPLRRKLTMLSAVAWTRGGSVEAADRAVDVVHLNGLLDDAPAGVTFSPTQYAERLAGQEPVYAQCAAEVLSHPVVFIGTPLDESPLWQHVQMRKKGPRAKREFRRESFIITPKLDRPRIELLQREFNVTHIPLTVAEFAQELLPQLSEEAGEGFALLASSASILSEVYQPPLAQDRAASSRAGSSDYLMGRSPHWGDIRDGYAAARACDDRLLELVQQQMGAAPREHRAILVTGTAGSGKSTAALRLALRLTAQGTPVAWVDSSVEISPLNLRRAMEARDHPPILVVDDADRYGSELSGLIGELCNGQSKPVLVLAMRSGRGVDRLLDRIGHLGVQLHEFNMPHLADGDIVAILDVLDGHNRLGVLKGQSRQKQIAAVKERAGRQLLVALLEATSGRRFEELIVSEMDELDTDARGLYALAAVASALRFGLTRRWLLLAVGDSSGATLGSIDMLQRRGLLISVDTGELRARHRTIAEVLMKALSEDGRLADVVMGLAVAAASKVSPTTRRAHRHMRRLRSLINHDWLPQNIGIARARELY